MCGLFKGPKLPEPQKTPTADEAAETARTDSLERRRKVASSGKQGTILSGGDQAQQALKKVLGA